MASEVAACCPIFVGILASLIVFLLGLDSDGVARFNADESGPMTNFALPTGNNTFIFSHSRNAVISQDGLSVHGSGTALTDILPDEGDLVINFRIQGKDKVSLGISCDMGATAPEHQMRMSDCYFPARKSSLPKADCPVNGADVGLKWLSEKRVLLLQAGEDHHYVLFNMTSTENCPSPRLWSQMLDQKSALLDLSSQTAEQEFVAVHLKKGAKMAVPDPKFCAPGSARCGDRCFGVCRRCKGPAYCMCYPVGYVGSSGNFIGGAQCLLGPYEDGKPVESPALFQPDKVTNHKAYENDL